MAAAGDIHQFYCGMLKDREVIINGAVYMRAVDLKKNQNKGNCNRQENKMKRTKNERKKTKLVTKRKNWNESQMESKIRHPQTDRHMLSRVNVTRLETHVGYIEEE